MKTNTTQGQMPEHTRKRGKPSNDTPVIVVIGGGYAGLQTLFMLKKELRIKAAKKAGTHAASDSGGKPGREQPLMYREEETAAARLILIDRQASHLRKVLLFRGAVRPEKVNIPFANLEQHGIEFLQADVLNIHRPERQLELKRPDGRCETLAYDRLVVATGSVPRTDVKNRGGFDLSNPEETDKIRKALDTLLTAGIRESAYEDKEEERRSPTLETDRRAPRVVVVGGGLSGIEMAAELADELLRRRREQGLPAEYPAVMLVNSGKGLLPQASEEAGKRLERELRTAGVTLLHERRAVRFEDGRLQLENGEELAADLCIWALGLQASPAAAAWGLPVDEVGRIVVDSSLRIGGQDGCHAVGDCARVVDPGTGKIDGMSCREGMYHAKWLAKAIRADLEGRRKPEYRSAPLVLCASLGPNRGFAWTRLQGRDIVLTGSLGLMARRYTWGLVDLLAD